MFMVAVFSSTVSIDRVPKGQTHKPLAGYGTRYLSVADGMMIEVLRHHIYALLRVGSHTLDVPLGNITESVDLISGRWPQEFIEQFENLLDVYPLGFKGVIVWNWVTKRWRFCLLTPDTGVQDAHIEKTETVVVSLVSRGEHALPTFTECCEADGDDVRYEYVYGKTKHGQQWARHCRLWVVGHTHPITDVAEIVEGREANVRSLRISDGFRI